jgi:putative molybdopterin biosynthesis protein
MTQGSEIRGSKTENKKAPPDKSVATSSQLHKIRRGRGLRAAEIARLVGVSRQTIYAIESGDYVPNTAVALQLARVLEVTVEDLFSLGTSSKRPPVPVYAELLAGGNKYATGELVRIGRVGKRTVAVPAPRFPMFLSDADGAIVTQSKGRATIRTAAEPLADRNALVIAGCDPRPVFESGGSAVAEKGAGPCCGHASL